MTTSDAGSTARLDAAQAGDAVAWSHLYHELAPVVLGYLRAQRLPEAEDVAGEVMVEVVRDLPGFRGEASGLRSWVLTIAHHRLVDARRRSQRRPSTISPPDPDGPYVAVEVGPEESTLASEGLRRLEPALASLTEEQRTVLLLRVIGDLPIAEVARITGKRPGAVKQLQRRAAAAMRRALDGSGGTAGDNGQVPASVPAGTQQDPGPVPTAEAWSLVHTDGNPDGR